MANDAHDEARIQEVEVPQHKDGGLVQMSSLGILAAYSSGSEDLNKSSSNVIEI